MNNSMKVTATAIAVFLLAATTAQAGDPALRCEAEIEKFAGKYFKCVQNAEEIFTRRGDGAKLAQHLGDCVATFEKKFDKAQMKGAGSCAGTATAAEYLTALDTCSFQVTNAAAGGTAPECGGGGLVPGVDPILPATGQTTAYGTDSDGTVQAGVALSYTDNGDGTITDNNTGLMWEKKDDNPTPTIHDQDTVYTWSTGAADMDGTITTVFLSTLNDVGGGGASCFAGHCDWRIPNSKELPSIVDYEVLLPSVDSAFHQADTCTGCTDVTLAECSCTVSASYWSATTVATFPDDAWYVFFFGGYVFNASKTFELHVRAVRGGL
jgi:hypothetical protein